MNIFASLSGLFFMLLLGLNLVHSLLAVCVNFLLLPLTVLLIAILKILFPKSVAESVESIGNQFTRVLSHLILLAGYTGIVAMFYPLPFMPEPWQTMLTEMGAPLKDSILKFVAPFIPTWPQ